MKVRLSAAARADLWQIGDWIGRDSPKRAASFLDELIRRCRDLELQPLRNPVVATIRSREIRRAVRDYLLFYETPPGANEVIVLRILHGARDYWSILGGEPE